MNNEPKSPTIFGRRRSSTAASGIGQHGISPHTYRFGQLKVWLGLNGLAGG